MTDYKVSLFWPSIYKDEWLDELGKIFDTRWLGQGPKVDEFEKEFGKKFGYEYCVSTNSGTSALELAYHLIGINKEDKVITSILSCSATSLPLIRKGADIIFTDISKVNLTMDVPDFKKKMNDSIKAIVTVNLGGIMCNPNIYSITKEYDVPIVIDACQSLGISEKYGDYVAYSFQAIKNFNTFDGGMLICRNKEDYDRAKRLRWFGIDREKKVQNDWKCFSSNREICMDMEEAGYKFHMNDVAATVGLVGLKHSDEALQYRKEIADIYTNKLMSLPKSKICECICGGSYWLYGILTENRDELIYKLKENGIETDTIHLRNDIFSVFGGKRNDLPNMDWIESRYLYIPIHTKMTNEDAYYITDSIIDILK
uniref:Putative DegT/DnrJ/EryC1/StrS aminotransferase family protein n=1 Tax=viral metagenome TaxID=1070528 RepID=A0A6M3JT47_9ZZZZ